MFHKKKEKSDLFNEELWEKLPDGVYLQTINRQGSIAFSIPVKMGSFYLRKHDFNKYKSQMKNSKSIKYKVKGLFKNEIMFDLDYVSPNNDFNSWVLTTNNLIFINCFSRLLSK